MDNRRKVVLLAGTRPEAIKMIPVYRELESSEIVKPFFLSTGQHREMLDQVFRAFCFRPDLDMGLMQPGQTLPDLTARSITAISQFLTEHKPTALLVQGDTTTVLAGAIAASYARIPVGHVEAGLRTYNFDAPFPEEMNRRLTTPLCRWLFAPTERSRDNLIREAIEPANIFVTGNTVIDALLWMRDHLKSSTECASLRLHRLGLKKPFVEQFFSDQVSGKVILVTGHRRESFGAGFESICQSLLRIVETFPETGIVYPVHLNPNVREPVMRYLSDHPRIALIEPAGYEDFVFLMCCAWIMLSDSGGVQEEAPSLGKPVLVMRDTTERPEGVDAGTCKLVGTDSDRIIEAVQALMLDATEYDRRAKLRNPYGDGQASQRIRKILDDSLA